MGEGYVSFEEQKGFFVLDGSLGSLRDATRVRSVLECKAVDWSIDRADTDWRASISAAHFALAEVEREMKFDPHAFAIEWDDRNRSFHLALAGNCGSPHLLGLIAREYDQTRRYRLMALAKGRTDQERAEWLDNSAAEHVRIFKAALRGDTEQVCEMLNAHITKGAEHRFVVYNLEAQRQA